MTKGDRLWLRRQLAKLRDDIRDDTQRTLNEIVAEEARLFFLDRITSRQTETH